MDESLLTSGTNRTDKQEHRSLLTNEAQAGKCQLSFRPNQVSLYLSLEEMETIFDCVQLNGLASNFIVGPIDLWIDRGREMFERFDAWRSADFGDQALVAKNAGICYGVFGTGILPQDLIQNLSPFRHHMEGTDCVVRSSYFGAYRYQRYYDDFTNHMMDCLNSCFGNGTACPLVLSGYSQGAALAVIAAIDWRAYNPTVYTFGSTEAIVFKRSEMPPPDTFPSSSNGGGIKGQQNRDKEQDQQKNNRDKDKMGNQRQSSAQKGTSSRKGELSAKQAKANKRDEPPEEPPSTSTFSGSSTLGTQYEDSLICTDFDATRHYRIITTTDRMYDSVATIPSPFGGRHLGHMLLLENDPTMFGYPGFNADPAQRIPFNFYAHMPWFYSERIRRMLDRGCFPIPVGKWLQGHWCNYDDECLSGSCGLPLFQCQ